MRVKILVIVLATLLGSALAVAAQDVETLGRQAWEAYEQKRYAESARLYAQAIEKGAAHPTTFYNAACSAAVTRFETARPLSPPMLAAGCSATQARKACPCRPASFAGVSSDRTTGLRLSLDAREITRPSLHESGRAPLEASGFFGFDVKRMVSPHP